MQTTVSTHAGHTEPRIYHNNEYWNKFVESLPLFNSSPGGAICVDNLLHRAAVAIRTREWWQELFCSRVNIPARLELVPTPTGPTSRAASVVFQWEYHRRERNASNTVLCWRKYASRPPAAMTLYQTRPRLGGTTNMLNRSIMRTISL
jgi:hypothetical protein